MTKKAVIVNGVAFLLGYYSGGSSADEATGDVGADAVPQERADEKAWKHSSSFDAVQKARQFFTSGKAAGSTTMRPVATRRWKR